MKLAVGSHLAGNAGGLQVRTRWGVYGCLHFWQIDADQPLGHDRHDAAGDQIGGDTHVDQTCNSTGRIVRM